MASRRPNQDVLDALSDVVTVSPTPDKAGFSAGQDYSSAASYSGQAPMTTYEATPSVPTKDHFDPLGPGANKSRGKEAPAPPPPSKGGISKFANAFRRQTTEDKEAKRKEKERRMNKAIDDSTMKSSRMDIIDRLDLSGIHGSSIFHHDSPYDACSPHSNRNSRRAPVMAFDHTIDPMTGQPIGMRAQGNGSNRPGLSPLAAATMRKMDDNAADVHDGSKRGNANSSQSSLNTNRSRAMTSGQIPTLRMGSSTSTNLVSGMEGGDGDQGSVTSHGSTMDRDLEAERAYRNSNYYNQPTNLSKGRADVANPHADIWGVSSEPWQDFAQPAGDGGDLRPRNGRGGQARASGESGGSGDASAASSVFDMEAVMTGKPAKGRAKEGDSPTGSKGAAEGGPKRSKSLIKKFRSARQNPNVPPPDEEVELGNLSINSDNRLRSTSGTSHPSTSKRPNYHHHYSPSTPPLNQSPQDSNASLGRSGTLRAGSGSGYYGKDGGSAQRPPSAGQGGEGGTSPGLGRNGSIFGRLRSGGKGRERGEVTAR